jgi:hypothetical protein
MDKLKNNLSSIVALLATVSAIGAGFVKYGELTTTIGVMQDSIDDLNARQYVINETVDLTETNDKINDNYVSLVDRIELMKTDINASKNNLAIIKTRLDLIDAQIQAMENENKNPLAR